MKAALVAELARATHLASLAVALLLTGAPSDWLEAAVDMDLLVRSAAGSWILTNVINLEG